MENKQEKQTQQFLEAINKTTIDGFWALNTQGIIVEVNDAFCLMTGYSRKELVGMTIGNLDTIESFDITAARIERIVTNGSESFETRHRRKDGTTFPIEISATWMTSNGGRLICFGPDITERKQTENRIRHLQKSESLDRMAGAMAHHYNNLLTSVMGNLEMAMEALPKNSRITSNLKGAMQAAERISKLGTTMRIYLGQTHPSQKRLNLSETCRNAVSTHLPDFPSWILLETNFFEPGPMIRANTDEIGQLLKILLNNAREAIGDQPGTIYVSTCEVLAGKITGTLRLPVDFRPEGSDFACIRIQDTGPGIPEKNLEKIFDPFYSTKFVGRGLGLPIALGTIKSLGGCITVTADAGSGPVFQIFIPISDKPVQGD
ncbi:two-component system sensor histidine kinase NtrB [Desulfotignum phosphitoxidans]|uniref:histidine kinase n=1 Tax=Desulfotignum phosphitoxidans DSM 13687 TaxID=1286635 RepID=S0FW29_9BACT|nr:PAS domain-containing sensor histidine kinase [Desulfotignum phosphitoxidans]EMS77334.1 PAS/HTPase sensor protein [Desulfotignum phosphitoxidans DSM 13687]